MSEKEQGNARKHPVCKCVYCKYVFYKCFPATGVEEPEMLLGFDRCAVPSVVVYYACISVVTKVFHKRNISFLMLAHSVRKLYYRLRGDVFCCTFVRCAYEQAQIKVIVSRFYVFLYRFHVILTHVMTNAGLAINNVPNEHVVP